jgi:hypothetical protein
VSGHTSKAFLEVDSAIKNHFLLAESTSENLFRKSSVRKGSSDSSTPTPPNTTVRHGMQFGISKAEEAPPSASISIPWVFLIGKGSWEFLLLGVLER